MLMVLDPRTAQLDVDHTGLHARPGSREWIITRRSLLVACLSDIKNNRSTGETVFAEIEQFGGWQYLTDLKGKPFRSFDEFCRSPNGLGLARGEIKRRLTAQQLAQDEGVKARAEKSGRPRKDEKVYNIHLSKGTSAARLVARLRRDAPEYADRLAAGEFMSARAAALAAGIITPPSGLALLRRAWAKATPEERTAFRAAIATGQGGSAP